MAFGIVNRKQIGHSSGYTIELADVTNATATAANKKVNLTWDDPSDVMLEGATLAKWGGTLVVRKANSPPVDKDDGTLVINSTTRNAYSTTPLQDTNLENGVTYYYRFFPYSTNEIYTSGTTLSAKPAEIQIAVPTITAADFTYDGTTKTPTLNYDSEYVTATGDFSATNAGEYEVTFSLISSVYLWSDGTFAPKTITWNIAKAAGEVTIPAEFVVLATSVALKTLTITQVGDGELSVESGASFMVRGKINGFNLIISRVGTNVGTCQMTVKAAESNNYTAAQVVFNVTVSNYKYMTVKIDESNSNPETCCTYDDDAINMEPGSAEWDDFFGHYPCLFKNGVEVVRLNPNNFNQDINGNTVDISSGDSGDAMVAFPKRGLWMSKTGTVVTITMTDNPNDENFEYMAHKRGNTLKDKFYLGVYMGSEVSSKLRSLKGKTIAITKTFDAFETLATANGAPNGNGGSGYDQHGWYQLIYLQAMYVLKYKNLDSQTVIGRGRVVAGTTSTKGKTGGTETNGMDWGDPSAGTNHMKLFGIEDLWGNIQSLIGGLYYDKNRKICTATENFNNTGEGYTDRGAAGDTYTSKTYTTEIVGTTHSGFFPKSNSGGSSTTYYCDSSIVATMRHLRFGGYWSGNLPYGIFYFEVNHTNTGTNNYTGSRLMYL